MPRFTFAIALLFEAINPVIAGDRFSCGGTVVDISFFRSTRKEPWGVEAVLTVARESRSTILRYDMSIDFIGAVCTTNGRKEPTIVFQAYCGGSACRDLDNWGIIDPKDLRVLMVPNDQNRKDAQRLLGVALPEIRNMISIMREGEKLGVK